MICRSSTRLIESTPSTQTSGNVLVDSHWHFSRAFFPRKSHNTARRGWLRRCHVPSTQRCCWVDTLQHAHRRVILASERRTSSSSISRSFTSGSWISFNVASTVCTVVYAPFWPSLVYGPRVDCSTNRSMAQASTTKERMRLPFRTPQHDRAVM